VTPDVYPIPTTGSTQVLINGTWFGTESPIFVQFGDPQDSASYRNLSCPLVSYYAALCVVNGGAGGLHRWRVRVAGQLSPWSDANTTFASPAQTLVSIPAAALSTLGGESIVITGSSFGPSGTPVTIRYGNYEATSCSVTSADTQITCTSVAGIGTELILNVSVGLPPLSTASLNLSYFGPSISSVSPSTISSDTASNVVIAGSYFGPSNSPLSITISNSYGSCSFTYVSHTDGASGSASMTTTSCVGQIGTNHNVTITNAAGQSAVAVRVLSFQVPTISAVSMGGNRSTTGVQPLTVDGANFGDSTVISHISVYYGPSGQPQKYLATGCFHPGALNTRLECRTIEGVGTGLVVTVVAGDQTSAASSSSISYDSPQISSVSPTQLSTNGTTVITVTGVNFGTSSDSPTLRYGPTSNVTLYGGSCTVSVPHKTLICSTSAGFGTNLTYIVTVASQYGQASSSYSYSAPEISLFTPSGPFGTSDTPVLQISGTDFGPVDSANTFLATYYQVLCSRYGIGSTSPSSFTHKPDSLTVLGSGSNTFLTSTTQDDIEYIARPHDSSSGLVYMELSLTEVESDAEVCLMARESLDNDAAFVALCFDEASSSVKFGKRDEKASASSFASLDVSLPVTLRINETSKGVYSGYALGGSSSTFSEVGSTTIPTAVPSYVGIGLTSSSGNPLGGAQISTSLCTGEQQYTTPSCTIVVAHEQANCTLPEGVGTGFHIAVTWGSGSSQGYSQSYGSASTFDRNVPTVSEVLATSGQIASSGASIAFKGTDFGPPGTQLKVLSRYTRALVGERNGFFGSLALGGSSGSVQRVENNVFNLSSSGTALMESGTDSAQFGYRFTSVAASRSMGVEVMAGGPLARTCVVARAGVGDTVDAVAICVNKSSSGISLVQRTSQSVTNINSQSYASFEYPVHIRLIVSNSARTVHGYYKFSQDSDWNLLGSYTGSQQLALLGIGTSSTSSQETQVKFEGSWANLTLMRTFDCASTNHTAASCTLGSGVGSNLEFSLSSPSGASAYLSSTVSYSSPTISTISPSAFNTTGEPSISIGGANLGIGMVNGSCEVQFIAQTNGRNFSGCLDSTGTQAYGYPSPGFGNDVRWRLYVGNQWSDELSSSTSYNIPQILQVTGPSTLETKGGTLITINGVNFYLFPTDDDLATISSVVSVTYGPSSNLSRYMCTPTSISYDQIICTTAEGTGSGLRWQVTVANQSSAASTETIRYGDPVVYTIAFDEPSTTGGGVVNITGTNFGVNVGVIAVRYGPSVAAWEPVAFQDTESNCLSRSDSSGRGYEYVFSEFGVYYPGCQSYQCCRREIVPDLTRYATTSCTIIVAHTNLSCVLAPGVGRNYLEVDVDAQFSGIFNSTALTYGAPTLNATVAANTTFPTKGGQVITLSGTNFGPVGTNITADLRSGSATYNSSTYVYTWFTCSVTIAHITMECTGQPGIGSSMSWRVIVAYQVSAPSPPFSRFTAPAITAAYSLWGSTLATKGGKVIINGTNFGPANSTLSFSWVGQQARVLNNTVSWAPGGFFKTDLFLCSVIVPHESLACIIDGAGTGMNVELEVGGQLVSFQSNLNFGAPVILSVTPDTDHVSGGTLLTVIGFNFAELEMSLEGRYGQNGLEITVGGLPCVFASFFSTPAMEGETTADTNLTCYSPELPAPGAYPVIVNVGGQSSGSVTMNAFNISGINITHISAEGGETVAISGSNILLATGITPEISLTRDSERCTYLNADVQVVRNQSALTSQNVKNILACLSYPNSVFSSSSVELINGKLVFQIPSTSAFKNDASNSTAAFGAAGYSFIVKVGHTSVGFQLAVPVVSVPSVDSVVRASGPIRGNTSVDIAGFFFPTGSLEVRFGNVTAVAADPVTTMVSWTTSVNQSCSGSGTSAGVVGDQGACQTSCQNAWNCDYYKYHNATRECTFFLASACTSLNAEANIVTGQKVSNFDLCPSAYVLSSTHWICSRLRHSYMMNSIGNTAQDSVGGVDGSISNASLSGLGWIDLSDTQGASVNFNVSATLIEIGTEYTLEIWADLGSSISSSWVDVMTLTDGNGVRTLPWYIKMRNSSSAGFQLNISVSSSSTEVFEKAGGLSLGLHHIVWHGEKVTVDGVALTKVGSQTLGNIGQSVAPSQVLWMHSSLGVLHSFNMYGSTMTDSNVQINYARGRAYDPNTEHPTSVTGLYQVASCDYLSQTLVRCKSTAQSSESVPATTGAALGVSAAVDVSSLAHFSTGSTKFLYYQNLNVTSFAPNLGFVEGGALVNVTADGLIRTYHFYGGSNSTNLAKCQWTPGGTTFGTFLSNTEASSGVVLQCVQPSYSESSETIKLQIALNGEQYTSSSLNFTAFNLPNLTRTVSPEFGPMHGNTTITITGQGFLNSDYITVRMRQADASDTAFEAVTAAARFVSSTTIVCETPALPSVARGSDYKTEPSVYANITVALNGQDYTSDSALQANFLYYFPASVRSVTPQIGFFKAETNVTLTGRFFTNTSRVFARMRLGNESGTSECSYVDSTLRTTNNTIKCTFLPFATGHGTYAVGVSTDNPDDNGGNIGYQEAGAYFFYDDNFPAYRPAEPTYTTYTAVSELDSVLNVSQLFETGLDVFTKRADFNVRALPGNGSKPYFSLESSSTVDVTDFIPIEIDHTGSGSEALTDFQLELTVNVTYLASIQALTNYKQLAFYDSDIQTELYWFADPSMHNSSVARVWVKVPLIAANSLKTIYMETGGAAATTYFDAGMVFSFYDDMGLTFDATKWNFSTTTGSSFQVITDTASGYRSFKGSARFQQAPRVNITPELYTNESFIVELGLAPFQPVAESPFYNSSAFPGSNSSEAVRFWEFPTRAGNVFYFSEDPNAVFLGSEDAGVDVNSGLPYEGFVINNFGELKHVTANSPIVAESISLSSCTIHGESRRVTLTKTSGNFTFRLHDCAWSGGSFVRESATAYERTFASTRFSGSSNTPIYFFAGASPTPTPSISFTDSQSKAISSKAIAGTSYGANLGEFYLVDTSELCLTLQSNIFEFSTCTGASSQKWKRSGSSIQNVQGGELHEFKYTGGGTTYTLEGPSGCLTRNASVAEYYLAACNGSSSQEFQIAADGWSYFPGAEWVGIRKFAEVTPTVPQLSSSYLAENMKLWRMSLKSDGLNIPVSVGAARSLHMSLSTTTDSFTKALTNQTEFQAALWNVSSISGLDSDTSTTYVLRNGWTGFGNLSNSIFINGTGFVDTGSSLIRMIFTNYYIESPCSFISTSQLECTAPSTPLLGSSVKDAGLGSRSLLVSVNGAEYLLGKSLSFFDVTFDVSPKSAPLAGGSTITVTATISGMGFSSASSLISAQFSYGLTPCYLHIGDRVIKSEGNFTLSASTSTKTDVSITFTAPAATEPTTLPVMLSFLGNQTLDSNGHTAAEANLLRTSPSFAPLNATTTEAIQFYYYNDSDWVHFPNGGNARPSSLSPGTKVRFRGNSMSTLLTPSFNFTKTSGTVVGTCDSSGAEIGGSATVVSYSPNENQGVYATRSSLLDDTATYLEYQGLYTSSMFIEAQFQLQPGETEANFTEVVLKVKENATFSLFDVQLSYALVATGSYSATGFVSALPSSSFTKVYGPALIPQENLDGYVTLFLAAPIPYNTSSDLILKLERKTRPFISAPPTATLGSTNASFTHRVLPYASSLITMANRTVAGAVTYLPDIISSHPAYTLLDVQFIASKEIELSATVLDSGCNEGSYAMKLKPNGLDVSKEATWTVYKPYIEIRGSSPDIAVKTGGISVSITGLDNEFATGSPLDLDKIRVRWTIQTGEYTGSYLTTVGTLNGNNIDTTTPDLSYLNVTGFITTNLDLTLNGQVYTSAYDLTLEQFFFHDTPSIQWFGPKVGKMIGQSSSESVVVTARNIFYRTRSVKCSFGDQTVFGFWDSSLDNQQCVSNCNVSCTAPSHPFGNVTVKISINKVTYYGTDAGVDQYYEYENCDPGWVTADYQSPCEVCDAGFRSNEPTRDSCVSCSLTEYQPSNQSTTCLSCMDKSQTRFTSSTSLLHCLCLNGYYKIDYPNAVTACKACPDNANCPGGWTIPIPDRGHFRDPEILDLIKLCYPISSCPGGSNSSCAAGYAGYLCGQCETGYYHVGNRCFECFGGHYLSNPELLLQAIFHFGLIALIYYRVDLMSKVASLGVMANFFQLAFIIAQFRLDWPESYTNAMPAINFFLPILFYPNWLETAAVECQFGDLAGYSFPVAYSGQLLTPWLQIAFVLGLYMFSKLWKCIQFGFLGREKLENRILRGIAKNITEERELGDMGDKTPMDRSPIKGKSNKVFSPSSKEQKNPITPSAKNALTPSKKSNPASPSKKSNPASPSKAMDVKDVKFASEQNKAEFLQEQITLRAEVRYKHAERMANTILLILVLDSTYLWRSFFSLWACQDQPDGNASQLVRMNQHCFNYNDYGYDYHVAVVTVMILSGFLMFLPIFLLMTTEPKGTYSKWYSGAFYKRFREGQRRYFLVYIFRSIILVIASLYVEKGVFQAFLCMITLVTCLLMDITGHPYKDADNDLLEQLSLASLLVVTFVGMSFSMDQFDNYLVDIWQLALQSLALALLFAVACFGFLVFAKELSKRYKFAIIKKHQRSLEVRRAYELLKETDHDEGDMSIMSSMMRGLSPEAMLSFQNYLIKSQGKLNFDEEDDFLHMRESKDFLQHIPRNAPSRPRREARKTRQPKNDNPEDKNAVELDDLKHFREKGELERFTEEIGEDELKDELKPAFDNKQKAGKRLKKKGDDNLSQQDLDKMIKSFRGKGSEEDNLDENPEFNCLRMIICEPNDVFSKETQKFQQLLLSKFVFTVIKVTLKATSEMIPRMEIPTLLSQHSTFSAKLEEARVKLYDFWLAVSVEEAIKGRVHILRSLLNEKLNRFMETGRKSWKDLRKSAQKKKPKMLRSASIYKLMGEEEKEDPEVQLQVVILEILKEIEELIKDMVQWLRPFNRSMFNRLDTIIRGKRDRMPRPNEIRQLRRLKARLSELTFKLVMFSNPNMAFSAENTEAPVAEPPRDILLKMRDEDDLVLMQGTWLCHINWKAAKAITEIPVEKETRNRRMSTVDRNIIDQLKVHGAGDEIGVSLHPGGGRGGRHHRRGSSLRRGSISSPRSLLGVSPRTQHGNSLRSPFSPAVGDSKGTGSPSNFREGSRRAKNQLSTTGVGISRAQHRRLYSGVSVASQQTDSGASEIGGSTINSGSTLGSGGYRFINRESASMADALKGVKRGGKKSYGGSSLPDRRLRAILHTMEGADLKAANMKQLLELVFDNFDVSGLPHGSYERRQFMIQLEVELASVVNIHMDKVQILDIKPHNSGAKVYVAFYHAEKSKDDQDNKRVHEAFKKLLVVNAKNLYGFEKLRICAANLCDELLDILVKTSEKAALDNDDSDFVVRLGVVDPTTYITEKLLLNFSNSYRISTSDWANLQTGVSKIVEDFKFNVSVHKSGVEGVEVHPCTDDGTSFLPIPRELRYYDKIEEEQVGFFDCLFDKPIPDLDEDGDEDDQIFPVYFQTFQGDRITYKIVLRNTFRNIKLPSARTLVDVELVSHTRSFWGKPKVYPVKDPVPRVRLTYPATVSFVVPQDLPQGYYTIRLLVNGLPLKRVEKEPRDADDWGQYIDGWAQKKIKQRRTGIWNVKVDHQLDASRWLDIGGSLQFDDEWHKQRAVTRRKYDVYILAPARGAIYEVILRLKRTGVKALRQDTMDHEENAEKSPQLEGYEDLDYISISDTKDDRSSMLSGLAVADESGGKARYEVSLNLTQAEAGSYQLVIQVDGDRIEYSTDDITFEGYHNFDIMMGEPNPETFVWSERLEDPSEFLFPLGKERGDELAFGYPFKVNETERSDRLASVDFLSAVVREKKTGNLDYAIVERESRLDDLETTEELKDSEDSFIAYFHPLVPDKHEICLFMHKPVKHEIDEKEANRLTKDEKYERGLEQGKREWIKFIKTRSGRVISKYWQRNENGTFTQKQTNFTSLHMPIALETKEVKVLKSQLKQIEESLDNQVEAKIEEENVAREQSNFGRLLVKAGISVEGGHTSPILCMHLSESASGTVLYTGGANELCAWEVDSGKLEQCIYTGATAIQELVDVKAKDNTDDLKASLTALNKHETKRSKTHSIRYFFVSRTDGNVALYIQQEEGMKLDHVQHFTAHQDAKIIGLKIIRTPELRIWTWGVDRFLKYFTLAKTEVGLEVKEFSDILIKLKKQKRFMEHIPQLEVLVDKGKKIEKAALIDACRSANMLLRDAKPLKKGWLSKRGGVKADKGFRTRYFQLLQVQHSKEKDLILAYYSKEDSTTPNGIMPLRRVVLSPSDQTGVFEIFTKIIIGDVVKPGRRYVVKAKDDDERYGWMCAIRQEEFKRARDKAYEKKNLESSKDKAEEKKKGQEKDKDDDNDDDVKQKDQKEPKNEVKETPENKETKETKEGEKETKEEPNKNDQKNDSDTDDDDSDGEEEDEDGDKAFTVEKMWPIDYEAVQAIWMLGTLKFEPKATTERFKRVLSHFFPGTQNAAALKDHLKGSLEGWEEHKEEIERHFSQTNADEFLRYTAKQLKQRLGEKDDGLASLLISHIQTMTQAVYRQNSILNLDNLDAEDAGPASALDAMRLHKSFREGLRVRLRSPIIKVELTNHPSYVAYVLCKDMRVYMVNRRTRRTDHNLSLQTGNFGTPYGLVTYGEDMNLPKWVATLNKDGFRVHKISMGSNRLTSAENYFIRGEVHDDVKMKSSIAFEQLCGRVIEKVEYEAYEPKSSMDDFVRYYRGIERTPYKKRTLWWVGTRRLEGKGSLLYAVDMERLELNPWATFKSWAGNKDPEGLEQYLAETKSKRKCADPVGEIVLDGELDGYAFTKTSGGYKNITCIYNPSQTHKYTDFADAKLTEYYERLAQNSVFLGFDDGTICWVEYTPTDAGTWRWRIVNFPEAHVRNENGKYQAVKMISLMLDDDFRPFLLTVAGDQPLKWDIADPSAVSVSKELRPAQLTTRMIAWGTFVVENYQMISFGFASDFFWPPGEGTDWFFEVTHALNFDFTIGHREYLIMSATFSSAAMIMYLVCYFYYNTKEMTDAFARAAQTGMFSWKGYLQYFAAIFAWGCTLGLMLFIKGITYVFNCAEREDGVYYHRMIGNGDEEICFDPNYMQFWLMLLALPAIPFMVYGLRLRRIEGEVIGLPSSLKARASWAPKGWEQDVRPSTQYHSLVPNDDSTVYPFVFALIRVAYGIVEVLLLHLTFVKAALLAVGSVLLLGIAMWIPPYAEIKANSLNLTVIVCFMWTNLCAFINIFDAQQNGYTGGEAEQNSSDGETMQAAQSEYVAGIVIFYLLGIWLIVLGFPGLDWLDEKLQNIIPPVRYWARRYYTMMEKSRKANLKKLDQNRRREQLKDEAAIKKSAMLRRRLSTEDRKDSKLRLSRNSTFDKSFMTKTGSRYGKLTENKNAESELEMSNLRARGDGKSGNQSARPPENQAPAKAAGNKKSLPPQQTGNNTAKSADQSSTKPQVDGKSEKDKSPQPPRSPAVSAGATNAGKNPAGPTGDAPPSKPAGNLLEKKNLPSTQPESTQQKPETKKKKSGWF